MNPRTRRIARSIGAVAAGLVVIVVLSNGTDTVLEFTGVFPPLAVQQAEGFTAPWMLWLALVYRAAFMVVGGYVAAALAPARQMLHVLVLAAIGILLGIAGAAATWGVAPTWFSIALIALGLPCVWLGGKWRLSRARTRTIA
jgi:hypothetical protein